jgi:MerR family transcriptional regulator, light-induced transcriptional regulator
MEAATDRPLLRIGELSRRVGVSDHLLRAWESRYGLLQPVRSPGGFRLYSEADEPRIRTMQAYLAEGLSAAEAARARPQALEPLRAELADLAWRVPLALAGAGATAQIADAAGARLLAGDPVTEAERAGWPR